MKSRATSMLRNILATFIRQVAAGLLGLVSAALVARAYGPGGNGEIAIAVLLALTLSTFLSFGVASANAYHLGSGKLNLRQVVNANIKIYFCLTVAGGVLGWLVVNYFREIFFPGVTTEILWFALVLFPLVLINGFVASIFQGVQDFRAYNLLTLVQPLTFCGGVIILWIADAGSPSDVIAVHILSNVVQLLFALRPMMAHLNYSSEGHSDEPVRDTLTYGWKAHVSNILAFMNYKADVLLANFFLGPAATGVYVVAVSLGEKLWLISQAVSTVLLPKLSQLAKDEDSRRTLTPIITRWVLLATLLSGIFLAVVANWLIFVVFGDSYSGALTALWMLLPGIIFASAARVLANDIAARGRPELNMYTAFFVLVINVIGNLFLIPLYGLVGGAAATSIAYTLNLVLRLKMYEDLSGNRWYASLVPRYKDLELFLTMRRRR